MLYQINKPNKNAFVELVVTLWNNDKGELFDQGGRGFVKNIPYKGDYLSATLAYKEIINQLHVAYENLTPEAGKTILDDAKKVDDSLTSFLNTVIPSIFQNVIVKSIGDYAQEGVVLSKNSALEDIKQEQRLTPTITTGPTTTPGDSFRVGVANDRPSAYRMIFGSIFGTIASKNAGSVVGYYGVNTASRDPEKGNPSRKNFMVRPQTPAPFNTYKKFIDKLANPIETTNDGIKTYSIPTGRGGTKKKICKMYWS